VTVAAFTVDIRDGHAAQIRYERIVTWTTNADVM